MQMFHGASAMALAVLFAACNAASPTEPECVSSPIVDGLPATPYPEAALIEMQQHGFVTGACSGALVAPLVVLTAGHCVAPYAGWAVRAPFASQSSTSSTAETFDWKDNGTDSVTPDQHDVGLIYLDTAINLAAYPALATAPVADGTDIVNIGRIHDGAVSGTTLYLSKTVALTNAAEAGFPFDYLTTRVIELGDSGGPVEVPGATPHTIVAVNSGFGGGAELLARVDLLRSWIQDRIAAHGGGGAPASTAPTPAPPLTVGCGGSP